MSHLRLSEILGVAAITFLVYLGISIRLLPYVEPPTGDQPHYLLQTISLVEDGDLNLRNEYTTKQSLGQFQAPGRRRPGFRGIPVSFELEPAGHIVVRATSTVGSNGAGGDEAWYPKHAPGLPVLLVPGWIVGQALTPLLGGLTYLGGGAWPGTVFEMTFIGALLAAQVYLLAFEVSGRRSIALAVWAATAFSVPPALLSQTLYPEIPAALLLIYAFRHVVVNPLPTQPWRLLLVGLSIAALPWLNPRFAILSAFLALLVSAALWQARRRRDRWPVAHGAMLLGPLLLSMVGLRWYQLQFFGSAAAVADQYEGFFVPTMIDGRWSADWLALVVASAGLLVDRQFGLLVYAPIYALAAVGIVALWRAPRGCWLVTGLGLLAAPCFLLTADFRVWWGGWTPPARYLAVLAPLLAAPLTASFVALGHSRLYRLLFAALALVGVLMMAAMLLQVGDPNVEQAIFGNPSRNPNLLRWLVLRFGLDLSPVLPSIAPWFGDRRGDVPWLQIVGYLGVLGVLAGVAIWAIPARLATPLHDSGPGRAADLGAASPSGGRASGGVTQPAASPSEVTQAPS